MSLHVYANDVTEWVIAESVQEAREIMLRYCADWGVPPEVRASLAAGEGGGTC